MRDRPTKVASDQESHLTASDNTVKFNSLSREQVEGCQWRNGLAKSHVTDIMVTLKHMLPKLLHGEEPTLSYIELCTVLVKTTTELPSCREAAEPTEGELFVDKAEDPDDGCGS